MKEKLEQLLAEGEQRIASVATGTESVVQVVAHLGDGVQTSRPRCWASRAA